MTVINNYEQFNNMEVSLDRRDGTGSGRIFLRYYRGTKIIIRNGQTQRSTLT